MKIMFSFIMYEQIIKWRMFKKESPQFLQRILSNGMFTSLSFISIVFALFFFIFLFVFIYYKRVHMFSFESHFPLLWGILLIVYLILKDIGKCINYIQSIALYDKTIFTLPLCWKNIYRLKMIQLHLFGFLIIWAIIGLGFFSYAIMNPLSYHLLLVFITIVPVFFIQLFILTDTVSLMLTVLFQRLLVIPNQGLYGLFKRWSIYFLLSIIITFLFSRFSFHFMDIILFIKEKLWTVTNYLLYMENPIKWIFDVIYQAANGTLALYPILFLCLSTVFLYFTQALLLTILEKKNILPFINKTNQKKQVTSKKSSIYRILPNNKISILLMKDIRYLLRDPLLYSRIMMISSFIIILSGALLGLILANRNQTTNISIPFRIIHHLSIDYKYMLIFLITYIFSSVIAKLPNKITSFDAEGISINLLRSAPIPVTYVAYAKMFLHFMIIFPISLIFCFSLMFFIHMPISYFPLLFFVTMGACLVLTLINVGSTIMFPRFDWRHPEEIGNSQKAIIFRLLEYIYFSLLIYVVFFIYVFLRYLNRTLEPQTYIYMISTSMIFFSFIVSIALLKIAEKSLIKYFFIRNISNKSEKNPGVNSPGQI